MSDRVMRFAFFALIVLFAAYVAEPYVSRFFLAAETPRPVTARGDLAEAERATVELFQRVSPSVVHVFARPSGRDLMLMEGGGGGGVQSGTGFIWDGAGHVVTNNHVIQGARPVTIRLASGDIVSAEVVGTAPNYDLAVLRLGRAGGLPPPIAIGTSADLKVGQAAFAIGNPFGLDQTLTTGVISALQRRLPTSEGREIADVIQTDASINPGNSGGPLLDSAGRLIGVNTAIFSPSGRLGRHRLRRPGRRGQPGRAAADPLGAGSQPGPRDHGGRGSGRRPARHRGGGRRADAGRVSRGPRGAARRRSRAPARSATSSSASTAGRCGACPI